MSQRNIRSRQYPTKAEPVLPDSLRPEAVHAETLIHAVQSNPRRLDVTPWRLPYLFNPVEWTAPPAPEEVTLDKWYVEHQPNPWRKTLPTALRPFYIYDPRQLLDKEALHPDALYPAFIPRLVRKTGREPGWIFIPLHEIIPPEVLTIDKWYVEHQPNPWRKPALSRMLQREWALMQNICFGFGGVDTATPGWGEASVATTSWVEATQTTTWTEVQTC